MRIEVLFNGPLPEDLAKFLTTKYYLDTDSAELLELCNKEGTCMGMEISHEPVEMDSGMFGLRRFKPASNDPGEIVITIKTQRREEMDCGD